MGVKSVIDMDVDMTKFQRFQELFDKYVSHLEKTPNVWKSVGKEQAALVSNFERMTAAMMAQAEQAREEVAARATQNRQLGEADRLWSSIGRSTKSVSKNILGATTSLLKWTGILTGIGGLLGVGGLFGLDKLTANLGNERRTAMGLGMSVGQYRAFGLDFSKALDTDRFLSDVQEMQTNPSASGGLLRFGINPNGKTEDVALTYLDRLRNLAVSTDTSRLGLLNQQYGTNLSTPEWVRLRELSSDEFNDMRKKNAADRKNLEVSDPIARRWQDLGIQLDRAGMQIKNIFEIRLAKLTGPLTDLSDKFVEAARAFANSGFIEKGIDLVGKGLDWLGKEIGSKEFQQDVTDFANNVGRLAVAAGNLAMWLLGPADKPGSESRTGHALRWLIGSDKDKSGKPAEHAFWGPDAGFLGSKHAADAIRKWFTDGSPGYTGDEFPSMMPEGLPTSPASPNASGGPSPLPALRDAAKGFDRAPSTVTHANSNSTSYNSTTNNYGRGGSTSLNVTITAPPGFSTVTTLGGLTAGLA